MSLMHRIRRNAPPEPASVPMKKGASVPSSDEQPAVERKKRGPKPSGKAKVLITLRLSPDVIAKFKATGPGWQARIDEALSKVNV